jgi:signal transduction histidine kinase
VVDLLIAALLYAALLVTPVIGPAGTRGRLNAGTATVAAIMCGALVVRRRASLPVLAIAVAGYLAYGVLGNSRGPVTAVVMLAAYTVSSTSDRRTSLMAGGGALLGLAAGGALLDSGLWHDADRLFDLASVAAALAVGDATRSRRGYLAEVQHRVRWAEQTREEEARRRVTEERLRIARDLHDVVAHHIALISVQAGVGAHMLDQQPEQTREAL